MFKTALVKIAGQFAGLASSVLGKGLLLALGAALLFGGVQSVRLTLTQKDLTFTKEKLAQAQSQIAALTRQLDQQTSKTIPALQALIRGAYDSAEKTQRGAANRNEIMAQALPAYGASGNGEAPLVVDAKTSRAAIKHLNNAFGFGGVQRPDSGATAGNNPARMPAPASPGP